MPANFPFGYRHALAPYEPEQRIIKVMLQMANQGMTQRDIAQVLNEKGITCRGKKWQQATISRILKREGVEQPVESS